MMHHAAQAYILVLSLAAIMLVARTDPVSRWGFVAGLASEPGWLYAAWESGQWGVMLLSIWWGGWWAVGAWRRFPEVRRIFSPQTEF